MIGNDECLRVFKGNNLMYGWPLEAQYTFVAHNIKDIVYSSNSKNNINKTELLQKLFTNETNDNPQYLSCKIVKVLVGANNGTFNTEIINADMYNEYYSFESSASITNSSSCQVTLILSRQYPIFTPDKILYNCDFYNGLINSLFYEDYDESSFNNLVGHKTFYNIEKDQDVGNSIFINDTPISAYETGGYDNDSIEEYLVNITCKSDIFANRSLYVGIQYGITNSNGTRTYLSKIISHQVNPGETKQFLKLGGMVYLGLDYAGVPNYQEVNCYKIYLATFNDERDRV